MVQTYCRGVWMSLAHVSVIKRAVKEVVCMEVRLIKSGGEVCCVAARKFCVLGSSKEATPTGGCTEH